MCELMTIAAALVFTALLIRARKSGAQSGALATTTLAFWGAALMWSVDCVHSFMEGEGLLDLSAGDAALGVVIICVGLLLFAALRLMEVRRGRQATSCRG